MLSDIPSFLIKLIFAICLASSSSSAQTIESLQGKWTSYFYRSLVIARSTITVTGKRMVYESEFFNTLALAPSSGEMLRRTFDIESITPDEKNPKLMILSLKYVKYEAGPTGGFHATKLNNEAWCSIRSWRPGEYKDITGRYCQETRGNVTMPFPQPRAGTSEKMALGVGEDVLYAREMITLQGPPRMDYKHPLYKVTGSDQDGL